MLPPIATTSQRLAKGMPGNFCGSMFPQIAHNFAQVQPRGFEKKKKEEITRGDEVRFHIMISRPDKKLALSEAFFRQTAAPSARDAKRIDAGGRNGLGSRWQGSG